MSTPTHITAACGQLRAAWAWLAEAVEPGNARRPTHQQSDTARHNADRLARAERADRHAVLTAGRAPTGASPAPVSIAVVDTRTRIAADVDATAWTVASANRGCKQGTPYRPDGRTADHVVTTALDWLTANAGHVTHPGTLDDAYTALTAADTLARAVAGAGPDRRPLGACECPCCGRRSLVYDMSSPTYTEWAIECSNKTCRCQGVDCACRIPGRQAGMTHLWLQPGWKALGS